MCVGMKQVDVRVIIVQCLERDYILNKDYNTVSLCIINNRKLLSSSCDFIIFSYF